MRWKGRECYAEGAKTPPWSKGANDPAMSESCEFLAPDIDNVPDLHGNPADAELELFIGGNQQQLIAGFKPCIRTEEQDLL